VATTVAVLVALFKEDYLRLRRHPKLTASIEAKHPNCIRTAVQWRGPDKERPWKGWIYWLRIWVKNEGNERAEKVEVFLSRAWEWKNGSFELLPTFTPMNLVWSYTKDIYVEGISSDMRRLCDLGSILEPEYARPARTETRLALRLQADGLSLSPGRYKFEIMIAGSNCKPVAHCFHLHLTGRWHEEPAEMLAHGFTFEPP